jgi:uncharacterized protein (DUF1015 family)
MYVYSQDYVWGGKRHRRLGFIGLVGLEELGNGAYPHERTLSGPKADRLQLLLSCRVNFSPIFSLYSDSGGRIENRLAEATADPPLIEFKDSTGVANLLWRLEDQSTLDWVSEEMRNKDFMIADGHHRYETALEFRRLMRGDPSAFRESYNYVMMCMVRMESSALTVLPFHRLLVEVESPAVRERLEKGFEVEDRPLPERRELWDEAVQKMLEEESEQRAAFALYQGGPRLHLLKMRAGFDTSPFIRPETSPLVAGLDVSVLHQVIFQGLLGLDEAQLVQEGKIAYLSRVEEAIEKVRTGGVSVAFFLRPPRVDQVWRIAAGGQKMPQKSTNFYPKLMTGLVFNEL